MEAADFLVAGVIGLFLVAVFYLGHVVGSVEGEELEREAVKRGLMVQCVGKTGYYFECEKDKQDE